MFFTAQERQRGFSALEMAVAIVVLGIAFVITLKGITIVDSMKGTVVANQMRQFQTFVQNYSSEYHYLPGDDPIAPSRSGRPEAITITAGIAISDVGNGKIDGFLNDPVNANGEQYMAWRDLRYAGVIEGDPTLAGESAMPSNAFGGVFGFDSGNLGQKDGSLCVTKIPGAAAERIDKHLDDGIINTGTVVATSRFSIDQHNHFSAPDTAPYDPKKTYIVCMPLNP